MATRYWVGGGSSAAWNATGNTNWGTASGTRDNASVPTSSDDVVFDNSTNGNTPCTISAAAECKSVDFTGWSNTLTHNAAITLTVSGSVTFSRGMTYTKGNAATSALAMNATGTLTTNLKTLGSITFSVGDITLGDELNTTGTLTLSSGSFVHNNQTVKMTTDTSSSITGSFTFWNLWKYGGGGVASDFTMPNSTVENELKLIGGGVAYYNLFLTGTFTCNGSVWANLVTFYNATGAGTASFDFSTLIVGDGGGNTNITGSAPLNIYFKTSGTDVYIDGAYWYYKTNGGGGSARVPLAQDTAIFDNSSVSSSTTLRFSVATGCRVGFSIDTSQKTNATSFNFRIRASSDDLYLWARNLDLTGRMSGLWSTDTGTTLYLSGYTDTNLKGSTYGGTLSIGPTNGLRISKATGKKVTLTSNLTKVNKIYVNSGEFDTSGYDITSTYSYYFLNSSVVNFRSSTLNFNVNYGVAVFQVDSGVTLDAGTSTIVMNFTQSSGDSCSFTCGNVPLNNIRCTASVIGKIGFTNTIFNGNFDLSLATSSFDWTGLGAAKVKGNISLPASYTNMNITAVGTSGTQTITSAGASIQALTIDGVGGTLQLSSALTCTGAVTLTNGTLNTNGYSLTAASFSSDNSNERVLTLGSSTFYLTTTSSMVIWDITDSTNMTLNKGTSVIKLTGTSGAQTFDGGGLTYHELWFAKGNNSNNLTIAGSNTFSTFRNTGTNAHSMLFTAGTTQTVDSFAVSGSSGKLITINSTNTSTHALTKAGGGRVSCDYLNIQHSVATPDVSWYAGKNSTNNQSVSTAGSGWYFTPPTADFFGIFP